MLAMANISIDKYLPVFAKLGVPVSFLVPTPTGYQKSIMDAIAPVRDMLKNNNIHDYQKQLQGQENKELREAKFVGFDNLLPSEASLYRPNTKKGDPRIWFKNLKKYCQPTDLLAIVPYDNKLYVFNLSSPFIEKGLLENGFAYSLLQDISSKENAISEELRNKIQEIHNRGFIPSITKGDPGVGDTLEHALGILRNNSKLPDYKGIELKSSRIKDKKKQANRNTLFTKVPDEGMTYRQIVETYGKWQIPKQQKGKPPITEPRLQLYETLSTIRVNAYDLTLKIAGDEKLDILHSFEGKSTFVSAWIMSELRKTLLNKHRETFWVKATSDIQDGIEYFRYDKILHTKKPNDSLLQPLIESAKVTIDLAAHFEKDGKWRDHGILFKIKPHDIPLLFSDPTEYTL